MNPTAPLSTQASTSVPFPIRLLRRLHPVVVALLGSPLHGLLSRDVLLLHYTGKRSGKPYVLPLSYVTGPEGIFLCTRPEGSAWWRNLRGGAAVGVTLRGRRLDARATVLEASSDEALEGLRRFVVRNPGTGALLYNIPRRGAEPSAKDLEREVRLSIVVRVNLAAGPVPLRTLGVG